VSAVLEAVAARCADLEDAMRILRFGSQQVPFVLPAFGVGGEDVHKALLDVRARLDAAEQLKLAGRKLRREFRDKARLRAQERDDEYDDRLDKLSAGAVRREWESGREREARARLQVVEMTRTVRTAEAARSRVEEMFDSLTDMFFGLLNIREELIARLRELQFETAMER